MAEFRAGLHTRQEERYVFWLLLGGDNLRRLLVPQFPAKNRGGWGALIRDRVLIQENMVL